jgi:hypothetical protein
MTPDPMGCYDYVIFPWPIASDEDTAIGEYLERMQECLLEPGEKFTIETVTMDSDEIREIVEPEADCEGVEKYVGRYRP